MLIRSLLAAALILLSSPVLAEGTYEIDHGWRVGFEPSKGDCGFTKMVMDSQNILTMIGAYFPVDINNTGLFVVKSGRVTNQSRVRGSISMQDYTKGRGTQDYDVVWHVEYNSNEDVTMFTTSFMVDDIQHRMRISDRMVVYISSADFHVDMNLQGSSMALNGTAFCIQARNNLQGSAVRSVSPSSSPTNRMNNNPTKLEDLFK